MRSAVVLLLAGIAAAPVLLPEPYRFAEETLRQAERAALPYRRVWRSAMRGDAEAIRRLLLFKSDAAGGLFHGVDVTAVIDRIGEAPVARVIASLERKDREWVRCLLGVGVAYGKRDAEPADAPRLYPRCWAAASP
ncbi:MAG TPA: hypothetical protein VEJ18_12100 [Planctomycetota bacterium]|nr:hypothetical protein [Planctomycetota bacterium]